MHCLIWDNHYQKYHTQFQNPGFSEVTILPAYVKKARLKATLKDIKNSTNNKNFLMDEP